MLSQYEIVPLAIDDIPQLANVIVAAFSDDQVDYEGNDKQEFLEYLDYFGAQCAEQQLGFVAKCRESGAILGGVMCCDLAETFASSEFLSQTDSDPMFALLYQLNQQHFDSFVLPKSEYLNFKFIAVATPFVGQGIAAALVNKALAQGLAFGYQFAHTESAGARSQFLFADKFGFERVGEIRYDAFSYQGKAIFQATEHHQSIQLLIKKLTEPA